MQGTQVRALVQEDPTCLGATKPTRDNYWDCALDPVLHNKRSHNNEKPTVHWWKWGVKVSFYGCVTVDFSFYGC